jgi:hypothetical protein
MINVCCVYYGNKYKPEYVKKLYNMVQRHLTVPHEFYCFTDHVNLFDIVTGKIHFKSFPRHDMEGWWNKLQLFNPDTNLKGVNFYLDLDVVILKNIDCFINYGDENTFGIIRDFGQPHMWYNSSVMRWNNSNASSLIWEPYMNDRPKWKKMQGDQNVITDLIRDKPILKLFPDEWTQSYKWLDRSQTRFSKKSMNFEQSPHAKIAIFHGHPNPHESDKEWVKSNWK